MTPLKKYWNAVESVDCLEKRIRDNQQVVRRLVKYIESDRLKLFKAKDKQAVATTELDAERIERCGGIKRG